MATRIAAWRSRLEVLALVLLLARLIDFGADVAKAVSWGYGSLGDWFGQLGGYPMILPGLLLAVSLGLLVITRIVYSWPKGTPMTAAFLSAVGAVLMGSVGALCSLGAAVTQLARMGRAADYASTAPAFLAGALYELAGFITYAAAAILAAWLVGELRSDRPPRPARRFAEPESAPH
jgi:hypothetical protein